MLAQQCAEDHKRPPLYLQRLKPVLSSTLSEKHKTYMHTLASILIYNKHITVTYIRNFHEFIYKTTTLTCTYNILIPIRISCRKHTCTEAPVGTFRAERCTLLYSYSLFRLLSYNCLTTYTSNKKLIGHNTISTRRYGTVLRCRSTKQEYQSTDQRRACPHNRSVVALSGVSKHLSETYLPT